MTIYRCKECGGEGFSPLTTWEHRRLPNGEFCPIGQKRWRTFKAKLGDEKIQQEWARQHRAAVRRPAWSEHDQEFPLGCGNSDCLRCYGGPPKVRDIHVRGGRL